MKENQTAQISREKNIEETRVRAVCELIERGYAPPFIAKFRGEATGGMDEAAVRAIRARMEDFAALERRRESVRKSLKDWGALTPDVEMRVNTASSIYALDDIYTPLRPGTRTPADIAMERKLEPLARLIFEQDTENPVDPEAEARPYCAPGRQLATPADALAGAREIIAQWISRDPKTRGQMRRLFIARGRFRSRVIPGQEQEGARYRDYFHWSEAVTKAPSHRVLAVIRGEKEGVLSLQVLPPDDEALDLLRKLYLKESGPASAQVDLAIKEAWTKVLGPALESELRAALKVRADEEAIRVFADNLRQILLSPPLGPARVLAVEPGFTSGCRVVCLNREGRLEYSDTIFPLAGDERSALAGPVVMALCEKYQIEAVAVGNGAGGRETEAFVRGLGLPENIIIALVNEAGATVYANTKEAREEFPDQEASLRMAVTIGRRLMDPLAELVRVDPRTIGVGQYQHDVDQKMLRRALEDVIESCVNFVGADVNAASSPLLSRICGLNAERAAAIVSRRREQGPFASLEDLKSVPGITSQVWEQATPFLRIQRNGESWTDPRGRYKPFKFAAGITCLENLRPGMTLPGLVTNITAFGIFVDIGAGQDGLLHVSRLSSAGETPDMFRVHQALSVTVAEVDMTRRRISLALPSEQKSKGRRRSVRPGKPGNREKPGTKNDELPDPSGHDG